MVRAGKIRYAAVSDLAAWQLADAAHTARTRSVVRFAAVQAEWDLLARDAEHEPSVLVGASSVEQVAANAAAMTVLQTDVLEAVARASEAP